MSKTKTCYRCKLEFANDVVKPTMIKGKVYQLCRWCKADNHKSRVTYVVSISVKEISERGNGIVGGVYTTLEEQQNLSAEDANRLIDLWNDLKGGDT